MEGDYLAKSQKNHTYVLKINTKDMVRSNWNLKISLREARQNEQVVALNDSQLLRWMFAKQGRENASEVADGLKSEIKSLKKLPSNRENKTNIKKKYNELYQTMFQQDLLMLVMDKKTDYDKAMRKCSITITDIIDEDGKQISVTKKYKRLLGTAGSIKKSTILFVSEEMHPFLMKKINNGRNMNKELVAAKLEAYMALTCSGSISVTKPRIVVVDDCITHFKCDVINIDDSDETKEDPDVIFIKDRDIENNASDGFGLMSPQIAAQWAKDLHEGEEPLSGVNTRYAFTKGMLICMDFLDFSEKIAGGNYIITDAWGDKRDLRNVDAILTTSMVKLWDSYDSFEEFDKYCDENLYDFSVAKTAPVELENKRTTNYQFIQGFLLDDEQINELISPTVNNIKDCLGMDWIKSILYLCGSNLNNDTVKYVDPLFRAIMIDHDIIKDKWVRQKIMKMIDKRITLSKLCTLDVTGNYAIISGDPYSLLQSIYKMDVTGLLKAHECYHKYWIDKGVDTIVSFRAPMTSHNNCTKLSVNSSENVSYWYQYIKTIMVLNSWDDTCMRSNGADFDSDTMMTTDNKVLVDNFRQLPAIECVQRKAKKTVPTDADFIKSEKNGFGDSIGTTVNKTTAQMNLQAKFHPDSKEYKVLGDRILCGQLYGQNAIDRIKGIVARPMPSYWTNKKQNYIKDDDTKEQRKEKEFNMKIVSDLKPYFFIFRYKDLYAKYSKYVKNADRNCKIRFGASIKELEQMGNLNEKEHEFLSNYYKYMPVCMAPGVINRICWRIEEEFETKDVLPNEFYNYSKLKTSASYSKNEFDKVSRIYSTYVTEVQHVMAKDALINDADQDDDNEESIENLKFLFRERCSEVCSNSESLTNILIDLCCKNSKGKSFIWDICGEQIVNNLMNRYGKFSFPTLNNCGSINFNGERFSLCEISVENQYEMDVI